MLPELGKKIELGRRNYDLNKVPLCFFRCLIAAGSVCFAPSDSTKNSALAAQRFAAGQGDDDPVEDSRFVSRAAFGGTDARNDAFLAIDAKHFIPVERWNEIRGDTDKANPNNVLSLFELPLWERLPNELEHGQQYLMNRVLSSSEYNFWREWYQGFLDGKPLNWELQRRVALIRDAIWEAGPEAVADEIEKVRNKFNLENRIEELEIELRRATMSRHGIGGNMPPEPLDNTPVARELIIVWEALADLKDEIATDDVDPTRLQEIITNLVAFLKKGLAWCLKKGDLIVDTSIKWAIPASGTGYLALNPQKLEAVIEATKKLLSAF